MKRIVICILLIGVALSASAQTIQLDCQPLSGKAGKLYWQKGGVADSLPAVLDSKGQGILHLPSGLRKILATLVIDGSGVEFIAGEPDITLTCTAKPLSKQTIKITGSPENTFLFRVFDSKANLLQKQAWI